MLDVAAAYVNVLRGTRALDVAQSSVVSLRSFATDVQNLYEEGNVPKNDFLAAQVALADARQREIQTSNTLEIARAVYNRLLGRPLNDPLVLEEIGPYAPQSDTETLTRLALQKRPEMAILSDQVKAFRQKAANIRAEELPQFAFSGGNGSPCSSAAPAQAMRRHISMDADVLMGLHTEKDPFCNLHQPEICSRSDGKKTKVNRRHRSETERGCQRAER